MKLKDILAKAAKGEALTDEEKKFLTEHDPDKAANDAAAAARRKAEDKAAELEKDRDAIKVKLDEMQAKLDSASNAGKTDLEKAQGQITGLAKQLSDLQTKIQASEKEKSTMIRSQTISELRRKAGIQFVEGLDHGMLERSFSSAFEGVDQLTDENVIKAKVDTWKAMNKAAILDMSGGGGGQPPHVPGGPGSSAEALSLNGKDLLSMALTGDIKEAEATLAKAAKADSAGKLTIVD